MDQTARTKSLVQTHLLALTQVDIKLCEKDASEQRWTWNWFQIPRFSKIWMQIRSEPKAAIHLVHWVLVLRVHRHTHHPTSRRSYLIQQKSVHNRSQSRDPLLAVLESTPPNRFRLRLPFHPQQTWTIQILIAAVSLRYGRSTCPRQICWGINYGQQPPYRLRFV